MEHKGCVCFGGACNVAITKISDTTVVSFEASVAVDMNRIKVKMCMTVSFSSQTWVFLGLLGFGVLVGFFFFSLFYTTINPWEHSTVLV